MLENYAILSLPAATGIPRRKPSATALRSLGWEARRQVPFSILPPRVSHGKKDPVDAVLRCLGGAENFPPWMLWPLP